MKTNVTYLKAAEGGRFLKVKKLDEADFVRIPTDDYITKEAWESLLERYILLNEQYNNMWQQPAVNDGDGYFIQRAEMNGYRNALRIISDRALQQIDKSKADKHGYTLKMAEQRVYDRTHPGKKAFYITKSTPISLHIDLETATFLIKKDLANFYNYTDITKVVTRSFSEPTKIGVLDLLQAYEQRNEPGYIHNFYVINSDYGKKLKEFVDNAPANIIFEFARLNGNIGSGVYECSYWSNGII